MTYYLARMNAVGAWREQQAEERRDEMDTEQGGQMPTGRGGSQKPDDWTQEEWDHVPDSMKADVASGDGFVSRERIQQYIKYKEQQ